MNYKDINDYIYSIPKFEGLSENFSGKDVFEWYKSRLDIKDIEPINEIRFIRKFRNFIKDESDYVYLKSISKQINEIGQRIFDEKIKNKEKAEK